MKQTLTRVGLACGLLMVLNACTMKKEEAPTLTGPSEFGTAITLTATPDAINQDGGSQSLVTATARGVNGAAMANVSLRAEIYVNGVRADFGSLSARNLVTGSDGRATLVYTAPRAVSGTEDVDQNTVVTIRVTPSGTDFENSVARSVSIRLLPVGVVRPPNGAPTARFIYSPAAPTENVKIQFDASSSTDPDGRIVSYSWVFGDGDSGTGVLISRAFSAAGTYNVTLTVTDDRGLSSSTTQTVAIGAGAALTARLAVSPSAAAINSPIQANASASTPGAGQTIVQYDFNFGDGSAIVSQPTPIADHRYTTIGTYTITLTVTDTSGKTATATSILTISGGTEQPVAVFVYSPQSPVAVGQLVTFDASGSQAPLNATITRYQWTFGDSSVVFTTTAPRIDHTYTAPSPAGPPATPYTVTLRVFDNQGGGNEPAPTPSQTTRQITVR